MTAPAPEGAIMKKFQVNPTVCLLDSVQDFCEEFQVGAGDLVFASQRLQTRFPVGSLEGAELVDYRQYGQGEPTDVMVESIAGALSGRQFRRVIAIGGGTILDVAKLFALECVLPVTELFEHKIPVRKVRPLILVPTTCGTGSEMTDISILELTRIGTKMGLADPALYADQAVLIPELLRGMPDRVFGASAIDALVHSIESYTSPKATAFSKLCSERAMDLILKGFLAIAQDGAGAREAWLEEFLQASCLAGIAFGNAGCAAVHALSYPLGAARHVPHGEANAVMFIEVYRTYQQQRCDGSLDELLQHLSGLLACPKDQVLAVLDELLRHILERKTLAAYGVKETDLADYADIVMTKQGRLMANNYVPLDREMVLGIYKRLY